MTMYLTDHIIKEVNTGMFCAMVLLNLQKAFDTVVHSSRTMDIVIKQHCHPHLSMHRTERGLNLLPLFCSTFLDDKVLDDKHLYLYSYF